MHNYHIGMLNKDTAFTLCIECELVHGKMQVLHFSSKISEWGWKETGILMSIQNTNAYQRRRQFGLVSKALCLQKKWVSSPALEILDDNSPDLINQQVILLHLYGKKHCPSALWESSFEDQSITYKEPEGNEVFYYGSMKRLKECKN